MAKKIIYPFPFDTIPINDGVLDLLGFNEYYDVNGDNGIRRLGLGVGLLVVGEHLERVEDGKLVPHHYSLGPFMSDLYFLHELYEYIEGAMLAEALMNFMEKLRASKMLYAIESFLKWRNNSKILYMHETTFRI